MVVDTLLNNRFAINDTGMDPLDRGGMAIIYAGLDTETDQPIAAKTLLPEYQGDTHRRSRFRREAEVLKAVQHPYVVDLVEIVDGRRGSWILMELLEGESLRDKLDAEGAFDPKTVNQWLAQVCAALEHIHQLGYVHLDLAPQNIFLTDDGDVKLIDFGIAQKGFALPKREGDKLLGTAAYISPEHGSGRIVTPLSDIYSLGCVVFELLTGKKVFSEHHNLSNDATVAIRQSQVPELPSSVAPELNLPLWVDTVVARALMPTPEDRYPSATAFAEEFNAHANPPLIRLNWPGRKKHSSSVAEVTTIANPTPAQTRVVPAPVQAGVVPREQTRAGRWMRKELRNARRALMVFALLLSVIFGSTMVGGAAVFDWMLGVVPGSNTVIKDGNWYLRSGASQDSEILTLMMDGQELRVSGTPVRSGTDLWWPVSTVVEGKRISGYAHDDGIARTWLMDRAAGLVGVRDTLTDGWDTVTGLAPG